jgi:hypothetical protein
LAVDLYTDAGVRKLVRDLRDPATFEAVTVTRPSPSLRPPPPEPPDRAFAGRTLCNVADPTPEPDFVRHLRELIEAGAPLPQTDARRHHYVPSFLLARWATPQKREGKLTALTVARGSTDSTKPDKVAFVRELYSLTGSGGVLDRKIETFMSVIEQYAADPIKRLGEAPQRISEEDRWTVAFFLALQQGRTPCGLELHRRFIEFAAKEWLRRRRAWYSDFNAVARVYRQTRNAAAGDEEIRAYAETQKRAMPDPDRPGKTIPEAAFQSLSINVSQIALTVAALDWTVLTTDEEFIENDRGMAMWDPNLTATRGNMWESSATAETTVPLAPGACLKLTPGDSRYAVASADAATVDAINLRTYGWAAEKIFGTTTSVVAGVHAKAQANPELVPAPVAPKIHDSGPRPA